MPSWVGTLRADPRPPGGGRAPHLPERSWPRQFWRKICGSPSLQPKFDGRLPWTTAAAGLRFLLLLMAALSRDVSHVSLTSPPTWSANGLSYPIPPHCFRLNFGGKHPTQLDLDFFLPVFGGPAESSPVGGRPTPPRTTPRGVELAPFFSSWTPRVRPHLPRNETFLKGFWNVACRLVWYLHSVMFHSGTFPRGNMALLSSFPKKIL